MDEFEIIRRYFFRHSEGSAGVQVPVGDDAAVVRMPAEQDLVMAMDMLLSGRHFPEDLPPADLGYRSLAVNLSDLAAMGAFPNWCLLGLTIPDVNEEWLQAFSDGFHELASSYDMQLLGGDTVRGELAVSVQVTGTMQHRKSPMRRSGARPGDRICIGGIPGEAAAGLLQWQAGERSGVLVDRFCRPCPQVALGQKLAGVASACIDISDGLLADLQHVLSDSGGLGAEVYVEQVPVSAELVKIPGYRQLQFTGGDDYLLLFTLPSVVNVPMSCYEIGRVNASPGVTVVDESGKAVAFDKTGWNHFPQKS